MSNKYATQRMIAALIILGFIVGFGIYFTMHTIQGQDKNRKSVPMNSNVHLCECQLHEYVDNGYFRGLICKCPFDPKG